MVANFRFVSHLSLIFLLLLIPLEGAYPATAQTLSGITSTLQNTTTSLTNSLTNVTASTNVTDTNGSVSIGNPAGLPLPNTTIPISASTTLDGVHIFGNGTIFTSVNGVSMSFFFDPQGPGKPPANPVSLTVDTSDLAGNPIDGLYVELQNTNGNDIATGYTPITFSVKSGQQYVVYADNYQNFQFNHWDNGNTSPARSVTLTQSAKMTAFYSTGATATAPQPPTGLGAVAMSQSQINLSWTAPSNNGGSAISGYEIERSINGSTFTVLVQNTGNAGASYSDTGLSPNTNYGYRVSAINSVGASSPSNTASVTTGSNGTASPNIVLNNVESTSGTLSAPYQLAISNFNAGTGTDRLLVVGISANNNGVASVTYGGVPLAREISSFTNNDAEFWYLANPAPTGNVVATMSGGTSAVIGAYAFSGVNQTLPIPTHAARHNTSANNPEITITTKYPNDWVIDLPSIYGGSTLGKSTCVQEWDVNVPNAITGASSALAVPSPSTVSCGWTANNPDLYDDVALEINADSQSSNLVTTTPPAQPTGFTANTVSSSQIKLTGMHHQTMEVLQLLDTRLKDHLTEVQLGILSRPILGVHQRHILIVGLGQVQLIPIGCLQ